MRLGFLVVDKPAGLTSHDVVAIVRAVTGAKKVGHTGTLDPFATGVLPLALGRATRLIQFLDENIKVYDATVKLGVATDTGDPTGELVVEKPVPELSDEHVISVLDGFSGTRMQVPPRHSAVKVKGRPLYSYARAGIEMEAKARPVRIDGITLVDRGADWLGVRIRCGRGTYARVLAEEIGEELGTAGHLSQLRRAQSGPFVLSAGIDLPSLAMLTAGQDDWKAVFRGGRGPDRVKWFPREQVWQGLDAHLIRPLDALSHLGLARIGPVERGRMLSGGSPPPPPSTTGVGEHYLAVDGDDLVGVVRRDANGPKVVRVIGGERPSGASGAG